MYLSAKAIVEMAGQRKAYFLNEAAIRFNQDVVHYPKPYVH